MHRCLQIQDILENVFQFLSSSEDTDSDPAKQGARLARTCTSFLEPALNMTWHTLDSIAPLVMCLPREAYDIETGGLISPYLTLKLTRDLREGDYERINYYAPRIKVLKVLRKFSERMMNTPPVILTSPVLPLLWARKPHPGPLLPNVSELGLFSAHFYGAAIYPRLAIGADLRAVHVRLEKLDAQHAWDNIAALCSETAPLLRSVILEKVDDDHEPLSQPTSHSIHLSRLFSKFRELERLEAFPVVCSATDVLHLSSLPKLQKLCISLSSRYLQNTGATLWEDASSQTALFPALSHLGIGSDDASTCAAFLRPGFPNLQTLTLKRDGIGNSWDMRLLFHTLQTSYSRSPLTSITVYPTELGPPVLISKSILNLLTLPNLTTLKIHNCFSSTLDDDSLTAFSKAWPNMNTLELVDYEAEIMPNISSSGFLKFILSCPKLEKLTIRFDARNVNIPSYAEIGDIVPSLSLIHLDLCTSPNPIDRDAEHAFGVLVSLAFPRLQRLQHRNRLTNKNWERIIDLLEPILESRKFQQKLETKLACPTRQT